MKNKFNIWNKWDPLKVCMLGNSYASEIFTGLPSGIEGTQQDYFPDRPDHAIDHRKS